VNLWRKTLTSHPAERSRGAVGLFASACRLGNTDGPGVNAWGASETAELDLAGLRVGMIHDAGRGQGRLARLRRRFPEFDLVVFGHSHIPLQAVDGDFWICNPGSPTNKRRQPHRTLEERLED